MITHYPIWSQECAKRYLSRTLNTSLTTLIVLLTIFIFGGESIRGFMFALIIGVIIGTYSSVFIATPVMYDFHKERSKK